MFHKGSWTLLATVVLCILLTVVLGSCAEPATPEPAETTQQELATPVPSEPAAPAEEETKITIVISGDPETFNPSVVGRAVVQLVSEMVLLGLGETDPWGETYAELAAELPSIENGGVVMDEAAGTMDVTWKMREDVLWADGEPVTADDVVFTWEALSDPETGGAAAEGVSYVDSVEKLDDYTFVVHYNSIYVGYLTQFGGEHFVVWPEHYCDADQGFVSWDCNRQPLSNGPYVLEEWVPDDHLTFARNPLYFEEGKPYIDTVVMQIVPEQTVRKTMLVEGSADASMYLSEAVTAELEDTSSVRISFAPSNRWVMRLMPNLAAKGSTDPAANPHPILSDKRVRQAIRMAIDIDTIVEQVWLGYSVPVWTEFYRPPYDCDIPKPQYDPEAAAALLEEAGWTDEDGDGVRECHGCLNAEEGYPMSMEFMIYAEYGESLNLSQQVIAEELGAIGIELELAVEEGAVMWADYQSGGLEQRGDFDLNMWDDGYSGVDPTFFIWDYYSAGGAVPGQGRNVGRWINEEFDALLEETLTPDEERRREAFCQMAELLEEELPQILLWSTLDATGYSSRLEGVQSTINDILTWNVQDWRVVQ